MEINGYQVTSNYVEILDDNSAHCELDNCIRLVHLSDTEFKTINDLKTAVEKLNL